MRGKAAVLSVFVSNAETVRLAPAMTRGGEPPPEKVWCVMLMAVGLVPVVMVAVKESDADGGWRSVRGSG